MKKTILAMLALVMLLASCSKSPVTAAYIPSDALMVTNINVKQLLDRADAKNIDNISFVKLARQELRSENAQLSSLIDDIIANPTSTGLDLREDVVLFVTKSGDLAMIAPMHKESKFESFLNEMASKSGIHCTISKKEGFKSADLETATATFNGDVAIIPINAKNEELLAGNLYSLGKDNSMAKNKNFANHWKNRSEVGAWMDMNNLFALAEEFTGEDLTSTVGLPKEYIDELRKGSFSLNLFFDKGAIRIVTQVQGISDKIINEYKQDFNKDLVKYMPEKCLATIAFSYNMDKAVEMLENNGEIDIDEPVANDKSLKQILPAFGGSVLLDLFDFGSDGSDITPLLALATDIKDAATVRELIDSFGLEKKGDNYIVPDLGLGELTISINDKALYITNSPEAATQFANGGYKESMKNVASQVKKGNYMYMDLNLAHYPANVTSLIPSNIVQMLSHFLEYTEVRSTSNTSAEWAIYISEKKENSLLATLHFIDNNLLELGNLAESLNSSSEYPDYSDEEDDYFIDDDVHID